MDINTIISDFQLLGHRISNLSFKNSFGYLDLEDDLKKKFDVEYEIIKYGYLDEPQMYVGTIILYIKFHVSNSNKQKFSCNLSIEGTFSSCTEKSEETEREFLNMLELNGCTALFSVARGFVISLTSQSLSGGEIILPLVNIFKLREKKKHQENQEQSTE